MSAIRSPLACLLPALLLGAGAAQNGGASRDGVPIAERIGLIAPAAPGFAPSSFAPRAAAALGPETGTAVGRRVGELRQELSELQQSIASSSAQLEEIRAETVQDAQDYYRIIADINARLQVGTTPGNPILVAQWGDAQIKLDDISSDVDRKSVV